MIAVVLISISTGTLPTLPFVSFFGPSVVVAVVAAVVVVVVASLQVLRVFAWYGKLKIPRRKPVFSVNTRVHWTGLE